MATGLSELDRRQRARLIGTTVLSVVLRISLVLGLYAVLPISGGAGRTWLFLFLGLLAFVALVVWEARGVLRSARPGVRAVQAVAVAVPLFMALFASMYYAMENVYPGSMSEPLTKVDAMYLAVTVAATVGFGDITPVTESARVLATIHMAGNLFLLGATIKVLTAAVTHGRAGND